MKRCTTCGVDKPEGEFYRDPARRDGLKGVCKACELQRKHTWYVANRERAIATAQAWKRRNPERYQATQARYRQTRRSEQRADHLRRSFGLTLDEYDALVADQDGRCAICRDEPKAGQFLHVDHDHGTGEVRGLLCVRCNNALGQLRETVSIAERAVDYLDSKGFARTDVYELHALGVARARRLVAASS